MEIYNFCHLTKISYFHEVFVSPSDCVGCFRRMTFFHLDLIPKYIKGFTAPGKMWFVFNKCRTFRERYYILCEHKSLKSYVLPVKINMILIILFYRENVLSPD
jgi:hypothetical protein